MNADDLCGTVLGTCTLQKVIGRGGMGAVYLAQQSRPRRQVAVKVLLPITALLPHQQKAFLERFRRETDAAASLEHPNITPVHEYGEREGLAYLVMAYVSGGTLRDELEAEGKLPLTRIVSYLEQMAAALDFAHERKVVHRDIKPANILMTPEKRLLLTDFGLVKIMIDGQNQAPLSEVGMPMGTPDYMAPEQVIGAEVDARADIYSLGVLLYHMVTGAPPFQGATPMKVALQHVHMPPPLPRLSRPDLPPAAEQVILRALTKRPADRYTSARDLAITFRLALEEAGVQVDTSGISNEERSSGNRRRGLFDPVWRSSIPQVLPETTSFEQKNAENINNYPEAYQSPPAQASNEEMPRRDIIAQTSMTMPSFSGILAEENISNMRQANGLLYGSGMMPQKQLDNAIIGLAPAVQQKSSLPVATNQVHTPLPPVYEAEGQINALPPQSNPQSEQGIIAQPAHRLLFSPTSVRLRHKINLQRSPHRLSEQQDSRQTDKRPTFSAQSRHPGRAAQPSGQLQNITQNQAGNIVNKKNGLTVDRSTQLRIRDTLLDPIGQHGKIPPMANAQPSTTVNYDVSTHRSEEFKTDIASMYSQRITAIIPTKSQLKAWLVQFQQETWQERIKNNKRNILIVGFIFLVICIVTLYLISHAGSISSTTGLKQHGQIGLIASATTNMMTIKVVDTLSMTLIAPFMYHAHSKTSMIRKALQVEISTSGSMNK